ncbi:DsbC family protein [Pseudomonas aeruginosa]|uniref:DsbC family protein n=1 Tax=Pseudomonas aeruginosa TaxID=287 RepID=UPI000B5A3660|nr:DsbC family protein [Pseudomonas aeruginosa]
MIRPLHIALSAALLMAAPMTIAASPSVGEHNQTQPLPINGMLAAVKNEKLAFVSANGRFVFQGSLYDTWNKKDITSIADAKFANDYMDLKELGFRVDDLSPFKVGNGPKEVVVFYDPYCNSCHMLMEDAQQQKDYTFKFVAIPVMGEGSTKAVRAAFCTPDKELSEKILLGKVQPADLPRDKFEACDTAPLAKRVISTQLFGLMGVPFVVRDDGLVRHGYIKGDLSNWLEAGKQ